MGFNAQKKRLGMRVPGPRDRPGVVGPSLGRAVTEPAGPAGTEARFPAFSAAAAFAPVAALALLASCASIPPLGVDRVRNPEFPVSGIAREYRLAFVSDVHLGNNFSVARFRRLVDAINAEKPDCILIGGDDTLGWDEIPVFAREASRLSAPDGVYATLGNHDFFNGRARTIDALRDAGIVVLQDTLVKTPGGPVIAGIGDFRDTFPDMPRFRDILDPAACTVLVSHNPDFAEKLPPEYLGYFDIILSGHTHGGQITFFGYAPVLPSEYGQKYRTGTVWKDGVPVVVSNGAGFGGDILRFRLGAPSDFLLITLKPAY